MLVSLTGVSERFGFLFSFFRKMRRLSLHALPAARSAATARYALAVQQSMFSKTKSKHLSKGKALRNRSAAAVAKAAPPTLVSAPRRTPSKKMQKKMPKEFGGSRDARAVSPAVSNMLRALGPREAEEALDILDRECTATEISNLNIEQLFGIMRSAYENGDFADSGDGEGRLSMDDDGDEDTGESRPRPYRVSPLKSIEVPPVEIISHPRTTNFLPREMLRRILREEPGTSIAARTVVLKCLLNRKNIPPKQPIQDGRRRSKLLRDHHLRNRIAGSESSGRNYVNTPSATPVTAAELSDATLVGDAALFVREQSNHPRSLENQAIAHERPNTKLSDTDDLQNVADTLNEKEVSLTDAVSSAVVTSVGRDATASDSEMRAEGSSESRSDANPSAETEQDSDALEGDELNEAEIEALLPFKDGTVVPLSTNFVTRCDRVDSAFVPFQRSPLARRLPSLAANVTELPPLPGLALHGTIVAIKVTHNRRQVLETAVDEYIEAKEELQNSLLKDANGKTRRKKATATLTTSPAANQISLHETFENPKITVRIIDETDEFDFSKILFEAEQ